MIKTFRAKSIQQALELVRQELGPDASVLHTRRLNAGLFGRLVGASKIEVAATVAAPPVAALPEAALPEAALPVSAEPVVENGFDHRERYRSQIEPAGVDISALNLDTQFQSTPPDPEVTPATAPAVPTKQQPTALFDAFTALIEAEVDEPVCRELIDRIRATAGDENLHDPQRLNELLRREIEAQFTTSGPIRTEQGDRRVVALVGPTGVGKTTTIAKLAANFRLRQKLNVGLITVDTYRVAAVEQLRTYADIIDLPMEVVATPREMRDALDRLADQDLILMDTAGRSPRDEIKIQELRSILAEAAPDEVHLVLSAVASSRNMTTTAQRFADVGVTSLLLTKLDEATGLGHFVSLARDSRLPLGYLTNGQNVPDDISLAEPRRLADAILGSEEGRAF